MNQPEYLRIIIPKPNLSDSGIYLRVGGPSLVRAIYRRERGRGTSTGELAGREETKERKYRAPAPAGEAVVLSRHLCYPLRAPGWLGGMRLARDRAGCRESSHTEHPSSLRDVFRVCCIRVRSMRALCALYMRVLLKSRETVNVKRCHPTHRPTPVSRVTSGAPIA